MDFLRDIFGFLAERKKFWLLPALIVLIIVGTLVAIASSSTVAPFIYSMF